jgi:hypothetical protein
MVGYSSITSDLPVTRLQFAETWMDASKHGRRLRHAAMLRVMGVTVLYRPVGEREVELIAETGFRRFPPRLPDDSNATCSV